VTSWTRYSSVSPPCPVSSQPSTQRFRTYPASWSLPLLELTGVLHSAPQLHPSFPLSPYEARTPSDFSGCVTSKEIPSPWLICHPPALLRQPPLAAVILLPAPDFCPLSPETPPVPCLRCFSPSACSLLPTATGQSRDPENSRGAVPPP
jgi:hypothetical protein